MCILSVVQMSAILDKFPSFRLVLEFVKESSWCQHKYVRLVSFFLSFFLSLLRAEVQPTLDPSVETVSRPNVLAQEKRRGIGWCVQCVRDVREGRSSRHEQLVGYLLIAPRYAKC